MSREVTVYVREGCHLCADALEHLARLQAELAFTVLPVDIEADDALHLRYLERIPVIAVGADELSDFFVDEQALRERLGPPEA